MLLDWSVSVSGNSLMCINQHILPSLWQIHRYTVLVSVYYCTWHKVMEWMIYTWIRYKSTGCGHTSADTRIILRNQSLQSSTPKSIKQLKDLCIKVKCTILSEWCRQNVFRWMSSNDKCLLKIWMKLVYCLVAIKF